MTDLRSMNHESWIESPEESADLLMRRLRLYRAAKIGASLLRTIDSVRPRTPWLANSGVLRARRPDRQMRLF